MGSAISSSVVILVEDQFPCAISRTFIPKKNQEGENQISPDPQTPQATPPDGHQAKCPALLHCFIFFAESKIFMICIHDNFGRFAFLHQLPWGGRWMNRFLLVSFPIECPLCQACFFFCGWNGVGRVSWGATSSPVQEKNLSANSPTFRHAPSLGLVFSASLVPLRYRTLSGVGHTQAQGGATLLTGPRICKGLILPLLLLEFQQLNDSFLFNFENSG